MSVSQKSQSCDISRADLSFKVVHRVSQTCGIKNATTYGTLNHIDASLLLFGRVISSAHTAVPFCLKSLFTRKPRLDFTKCLYSAKRRRKRFRSFKITGKASILLKRLVSSLCYSDIGYWEGMGSRESFFLFFRTTQPGCPKSPEKRAEYALHDKTQRLYALVGTLYLVRVIV